MWAGVLTADAITGLGGTWDDRVESVILGTFGSAQVPVMDCVARKVKRLARRGVGCRRERCGPGAVRRLRSKGGWTMQHYSRYTDSEISVDIESACCEYFRFSLIHVMRPHCIVTERSRMSGVRFLTENDKNSLITDYEYTT